MGKMPIAEDIGKEIEIRKG